MLLVETKAILQTNQTVADPGQVDLVKKYKFKHYAVLSRELALHKITTATCLTDRVYWALILTSCCGPEVREGCFLRNADGFLVTVEKDQLFPLRAKHLLAMLGLDSTYRGKIHQAIKKLIKQGCLEERDPEKIWYPLLDPKRLEAETEKRKGCYRKSSNTAYSFLPPFLRNALPEEVVNQNATSPVTEAWLKDLKKRYRNALEELRKSYADVARNHFFDDRIIIEEEVEDIEEDKRGESVGTSSTPEPEQPQSPLPSSPVSSVTPLHPSSRSGALVVANTESEAAWNVFSATIAACGKPISVRMAPTCRAEFAKYPLSVQQRIAEDALIRAEEMWNEPKWTPDPLQYLQSQIWELKPIKPRSLPAPRKKRAGDDAIQRLMERARERDRTEGPLR